MNRLNRTLGLTGIPVLRIGLGLAALGRPGYINLNHATDLGMNYDETVMEQHMHQILDLAWQHGVIYVDAARSYGHAEKFLSSWLHTRKLNPQAISVGSKWGYTYTANWQTQAVVHEVKEHSLAVLQRQWKESQSLLGEYLRLYQVHSATIESGIFSNREVLIELGRLKERGIAIGVTVSGPEQPRTLQQAMDTTVGGQRLFDFVQITWNLLEPSATEVLQEAHAAGMGIIVKEALANGRLTDRNESPDFQEKYHMLAQVAEHLNTTVDALALAAALAQPWCDVVLSGAVTQAQLLSNLKAVEVAWDEETAAVLKSLAEPPDVYWNLRRKLEWN